MRTAHKIALAKIMYSAVRGARSLFGKTDRCVVRRRGNRFELDLAEGVDLAVYLGLYERSTSRALKRLVHTGATVLDVGANVGIHTVALARLVGSQGRVFAFEPTQFAFSKMKRNLAANPGLPERVVATQCFLGASDSNAAPPEIYSSWPLVGGTNLHQKHLGQPMATSGVASRSLDSFLADYGNPKVSLIKLDVDGYECDVLSGATALMQRDRPIFVMELAPYVLKEHGRSLDELLAFFVPLGYEFFDENAIDGGPIEIGRVAENIRDGAGVNVVAKVP